MKKDLTEFYVYNSMIDFLYGYEKRRYGYGNLQEILRELSPLPEGGTSNSAVWAEWKECINKSLKDALKTKPSGEAGVRVYTKLQAFNAMVDFFIAYYKRTTSGDLRTLMEVICSLSENSADQASWNEWNNAVRKTLQTQSHEPIDKFVKKRLTKLQAFNAMVNFLEIYYRETGSDFMGALLGTLLFLPDGKPVSHAFWEDWEIAIQKILKKQINGRQVDKILGVSIRELQAFDAMIQFFRDYYERDPDPDVIKFFGYLHLLPDNSSSNHTIKEKWKQCVDEALKESPGIRKYRIICLGEYIAPKDLN